MIKLSDLDPELNVDQLIDYLLDRKIYIVVNDLSPKKPYVKYELNDLYETWEILRLMLTLK